MVAARDVPILHHATPRQILRAGGDERIAAIAEDLIYPTLRANLARIPAWTKR